MSASKSIPPRYVPFVLKDTVLAVGYEPEKDQYAVLCPECHEVILHRNLEALCREMVRSDRPRCQGCRARATFAKEPGVIGMFLDFWYRTGKFPESDSWIEAIPRPQLNLWEKEIRAALGAARMKGER